MKVSQTFPRWLVDTYETRVCHGNAVAPHRVVMQEIVCSELAAQLFAQGNCSALTAESCDQYFYWSYSKLAPSI